MKKVLTLTLFLAIISAIAGGALAAVNTVTEPIIIENAMKEVNASLAEIFPGASFKPGTIKGDVQYITDIYEADGKGVAYKVSVKGFKDTITYLVAIDTDGNFVGYKVTENNDTSGIGTRVNEAEFSDQFINQSIDTEVDTLSGATFSSTPVVEGIKEVVAYHKANY